MTQTDLTLFNNAIQLYQSGQKITANTQFKNLEQHYPQDVTLLMWLAYSSSEWSEARAALEQAERLEPHNPNLPNARQWLQQWQPPQAVLTASVSSLASPVSTPRESARVTSQLDYAPQAVTTTDAPEEDNLAALGQCIDIYEKSALKAFTRGAIALAVFIVSASIFVLTTYVFTSAPNILGISLPIMVVAFVTAAGFGIWGLFVRKETMTIYEGGFTIQSRGQFYVYAWENLASFTYAYMVYYAYVVPVFILRWHELKTFDGKKWVVTGDYQKVKEVETLLSTLTTTGLLRRITRQLQNGETVQINKKIVATPQGLTIKQKFANWQDFVEAKTESGVLFLKTGYMEGSKLKKKGFATLKVMETDNALVLGKLVEVMAKAQKEKFSR